MRCDGRDITKNLWSFNSIVVPYINILKFGSTWCLAMAQIQILFNKKKKKDWTSRTFANPMSDNISFLPYAAPTLKVDFWG